jgi:hypothetical protein
MGRESLTVAWSSQLHHSQKCSSQTITVPGTAHRSGSIPKRGVSGGTTDKEMVGVENLERKEH